MTTDPVDRQEETCSADEPQPSAAESPEADDPLYPAAHRLARFYALLSPGILQQDLGIDRPRAERLMRLLAERGAVGAVLIERTGARESLINMVDELPSGVALPASFSTARASAGRIGVLSSVVGVGAGLIVCVGLLLSGASLRAVALVGIGAGSPALATLVGLLVVPAAAGWALGALLERILSPDDEILPYGALRARRALWTLYAMVSIGLGSIMLLR